MRLVLYLFSFLLPISRFQHASLVLKVQWPSMLCPSSWQANNCLPCLPIANFGLACGPYQCVRWWGARHLSTLLKAALGLLKLSSFWLQHSTSHQGFIYPFLLAWERRDCGAAFLKRELEPNSWEEGLDCESRAVLWHHNEMLLQLEHFGSLASDAAPLGVASTQLTGWNLLPLAWHWKKSIL